MRRVVTETVTDSEAFKKNIQKIETPSFEVDNIPGMPSFPNKWQLIHVDSLLLLVKHFKKKYELHGSRRKVKALIDQIGVEKNVRFSTVYSPYKIIKRDVLYSKFKNEDRYPRVFQYGNKFFPYDRDDLHLMAVSLVQQNKLIPAIVVNLTGSDSQDIGNALGDVQRTDRVFKFLQVPIVGEDPDTKDVKDTDADGNQLTAYQLGMFNTSADSKSHDVGYRTAAETDASISRLKKEPDNAHKVRATLLMIQRAKGALKNTKDPAKRKNLKQSLKKWLRFKQQIIDKNEKD